MLRDTALALIAVFTIFNFWSLCAILANVKALREKGDVK